MGNTHKICLFEKKIVKKKDATSKKDEGGECRCALFNGGRILGDAAFTHKLIAHQHGERGTVAACDVRARCLYAHSTAVRSVFFHIK